MYNNRKIGVTVPAHNEERFIAGVIDSMPSFVDKVYVVNDASSDATHDIALRKAGNNGRVVVIDRPARGGVGAAVLTGHRTALRDGMDVLAVMAGDGQMDPAFLADMVAPVAAGRADYAKGTRLSNAEHRKGMPRWRLFGNSILTGMTRVACGYYRISDPQDGYTAISAATLKKLDLEKIEKGFAFENDMLARLNVVGARVVDVPHPALYRGQESKIRYSRFVVRTSYVLLRNFVWRIWAKYLRRSNRREVEPA
jgi:glycosyltransferase involved in cell wall biosynthesis